MKTKQYLNQIERFQTLIKHKQSEICELKSMACGAAVSTNTERVQTSGNKDRIGSTMAKIIDMEQETNQLIESYMEKRKVIINQIDSMEDLAQYSILYARYIEKKKLEVIADEMGYSCRQIIRIHVDALNAFEKKYGKAYLSPDDIECHD